jgi:hypothetical protein
MARVQGVAAALDADGLRRVEAGRLLLARLQSAYEAPEAVEERGRRLREQLPPGGPAGDGGITDDEPAEDVPGQVLGMIFGMLGTPRASNPLFDVSAEASGLDAEQARCVLFAAAALLASGTAGFFSFASMISSELAERELAMTAADVRLLAAASAPSEGSPDIGVVVVAEEIFGLAVDLAERLLAGGGPGAAELAEAIAAQAASWNVPARFFPRLNRDRQPRLGDLQDRALALAGYPPPRWSEGPVGLADSWGLAAARWLGPAEDWPAGTTELLAHCVQRSATRPSERWQRLCRQHLDAVADPGALLRGLLSLLVTEPPARFLSDGRAEDLLVGYNEPLLKGLLWAAGMLDADWLPEVARAAAVRCLRLSAGSRFHPTAVPGEKIPYACFHALALSGSDLALMALARIGRATTSRGVHRQLEKVLAEAAARRGVSPAALMDGLLPDHGLSADGSAELAPGWMIRLDDRAGAVLTGPEEAAEPGWAAEPLADLRATARLARGQLEEMFGTQRELHVADFTDNYLHHPVRAWLVTRLAWQFMPLDRNGPVITGFPDPSGQAVRTPAGDLPVPANCLTRLAHPVLLDAGELKRLRSFAAGLGIEQPVRQLWRESFRVSAPERASGAESARYAGHVLRYKQMLRNAPVPGLGRRVPVRRVRRRAGRHRPQGLPRRRAARLVGARGSRHRQSPRPGRPLRHCRARGGTVHDGEDRVLRSRRRGTGAGPARRRAGGGLLRDDARHRPDRVSGHGGQRPGLDRAVPGTAAARCLLGPDGRSRARLVAGSTPRPAGPGVRNARPAVHPHQHRPAGPRVAGHLPDRPGHRQRADSAVRQMAVLRQQTTRGRAQLRVAAGAGTRRRRDTPAHPGPRRHPRRRRAAGQPQAPAADPRLTPSPALELQGLACFLALGAARRDALQVSHFDLTIAEGTGGAA